MSQDLTRGDMASLARFGKIRQDLRKEAMAIFGKIWQDLARFDKGDMARFGKM